tara:strand:+ start:198019 stop:198816 length:798 start_codon:yes stop_codon:yes gene_type:complete
MAQDFQGKAYYMSKTSVDMDNFGGRQMNEEQKKRILDRMKSMFEKTYELTFNKSESLYKEEEKLEAPGQGGGGRFGGFSATAGPQYKNVKEGKLLQEQEFFGKKFLIKDDLQPLEWVMGSETKQIGKYTCFKATATTTDNSFDISSAFRGRGRNNNESNNDATKAADEAEVSKEITITAWYTPQIPINQGPGEYWGLPGLILEVQSGKTTILCSKIVMNPEDQKEIKAPSKGKEISQKDYNETVKKKTEEMREQFSRGRGGRGRQ